MYVWQGVERRSTVILVLNVRYTIIREHIQRLVTDCTWGHVRFTVAVATADADGRRARGGV